MIKESSQNIYNVLKEIPVRATRAEINLDNLIYNLDNIKKRTNKKICAVVKADAYGHGLECIKELERNNVDYFAVAFLEEAIRLRKKGITLPIMLLGHTFENRVEELIEYNIEPTVFSYDFAKALSDKAIEMNTVHPIHLKIETGMGRIGIDWKKAYEEIERINALPGIEIKGIFTHFATADEEDKAFSREQLKRFKTVIEKLEKNNIHIPIKHIENSAAIIDMEEELFDMVRPGIILYGYYPSKEVKRENLPIKPVMNFKTKITQIKDLEIGDSIGYGRSFIAKEPMRVATLPIGYADGYSRILSHKGAYVLINDTKCPVLGNICMDQLVVDITGLDNIQVGDDVELFGENLSGENVADLLGTIPYEITCMVNKRVPRVSFKNNGYYVISEEY